MNGQWVIFAHKQTPENVVEDMWEHAVKAAGLVPAGLPELTLRTEMFAIPPATEPLTMWHAVGNVRSICVTVT